ncbi:hypothetical protein ABTM06_19730, partial [Acinetobacter baumannii]
VWALSAALLGRISFAHGAIEQTNFHQFPVLRLGESPDQEVHFVESRAWPGGLGEKGVPAVAPAVANAVFSLTGVRSRELPLRGLSG